MKKVKQYLKLKTGKIISNLGNINPGDVIKRYNIPLAKIEYYFIPATKLFDYYKARGIQDLNAHKKFGIQLADSEIR